MDNRIGRPRVPSVLLAAAISVVTVVAACGGSGSTVRGAPSDGGGSGGGDGASSGSSSGLGSSSSGSGNGGSSGGPGMGDASFSCDGCAPFPSQSAPACDPMTLGPSTLVYPPDGALLPPNMNVLEVQWVPPSGASLFEVDFENGVTDVRVETPCNAITTVRGAAGVGCGLTLSQQQWNDIANTNRDGDPLKVTVRATPAGGQPCVSSSMQSVSIAFAKDDLTGGIYYWQSATFGGTAGKTGGIYYHDFGTFDPTPTPFYTSGGTGTCVGCHTLSKDGARMSLMTDDPDADDEYGDVKTDTMDVASRTVIGGKNVGPGFQTFTHDHKLMIATTFKPAGKPGPGMGMAAPDSAFAVWNGDGTTQLATDTLPSGMQGTHPNLSWDDKTLVFVAPTYGSIATMANDVQGGLGGAGGDDHFLGGSLWKASFDSTSGALGNYAAFLPATGSQSFYYPDQSVDGNWVVFNENDDTSAANNDGDCFYSRQGTVKMMHFPPQSGDQPLELAKLNEGAGLSNSWPRWSPALTTYHGKAVLWVTFSSNRDYGLHLKNTPAGYPTGAPGFDNYYPPESPSYDQPQPASKMGITFDNYASPQIWMAAVIVDPDRSLDAQDRSYPAFWLPFQDVTAHNHSAQWVATVVAPPGGGGGDSGTGGPEGGVCSEANGACGTGGGTCCADVVCCPAATTATCQYTCTQ